MSEIVHACGHASVCVCELQIILVSTYRWCCANVNKIMNLASPLSPSCTHKHTHKKSRLVTRLLYHLLTVNSLQHLFSTVIDNNIDIGKVDTIAIDKVCCYHKTKSFRAIIKTNIPRLEKCLGSTCSTDLSSALLTLVAFPFHLMSRPLMIFLDHRYDY